MPATTLLTRAGLGVSDRQISVAAYGATGNDLADDTAAFVAAIATGRPVFIPSTTTNIYRVSATLSLPAGTILVFDDGRPIIKNVASSGDVLVVAGDGVTIIGGEIDGQKALKSSGCAVRCDGFNDFSAAGLVVRSAKSHGFFFKDCSRSSVVNGAATNCGQSGIYLENVDDWEVKNNDLSNNINFGAFSWRATKNGRFRSNWCHGSGLELYGQQFDCLNNEIAFNRADGSGDNGLSINGYFNRVFGNRASNNAFHGICIYGSGNVVDSNTCWNNGQDNDGAIYAGITMNSLWGGLARDNTIGPNICYDCQDVPTQTRPVLLSGSGYSAWASGENVTTNSLRASGDNVYRALTAGITGSASPTHLAGGVSDGSVTWVYCASKQRGLYDRQQPWLSGQAVTTGERRYNGTRIYEAVTTGTTGATAPTHTSASEVSDGGVSWRHVRTVPSDFSSTGNIVEGIVGFGNSNDEILDNGTGNIIRSRSRMNLRVPGREIHSELIADTQEASVSSAPPGSIHLRRTGGVPSKTIAVKVSGVGTSGWEYVAIRSYGSTAARPTEQMISGSEGFEYFDTTLNKPVWWGGSDWRDATGTVV